MSRNAFLTPETLSGEPLCYQLSIPVRLFEFIIGALEPLGDVARWQSYGSVSPEDASQFFQEQILALVQSECETMQPVAYRQRLSNASYPSPGEGIITWENYSDFDSPVFSPGAGGIVVEETGFYRVSMGAQYAGGTGGTFRRLTLRVDGNARLRASGPPVATTGGTMQRERVLNVIAGSEITVHFDHDNTSDLSLILMGTNVVAELFIEKID